MAYKPRWPNTFEDAITKIAGARGAETAAQDAGKKTHRPVYDWMDPDIACLPTLQQALQMDVAYMRATGDKPVILEAYKAQLADMTRAVPPARVDAPLEAICATIRETSEAVDAWRKHHDEPCEATANRAVREIDEGIEHLQKLRDDVEAARDKTVPLHDRKRAG